MGIEFINFFFCTCCHLIENRYSIHKLVKRTLKPFSIIKLQTDRAIHICRVKLYRRKMHFERQYNMYFLQISLLNPHAISFKWSPLAYFFLLAEGTNWITNTTPCGKQKQLENTHFGRPSLVISYKNIYSKYFCLFPLFFFTR